jgi:aminoglycoside phosphotransferase (APT) family kinase protein
VLAADDEALIQRDPDLPGLRLCLDEALLRRHLLGSGLLSETEALQVTSLRYTPGRRAMAALRIGSDVGYLHAWGRDRPKEVPGGNGSSVLDELSSFACRWPVDARLPSLRLLEDGAARNALLAELGIDEPAEQRWRLLSYRPERRAALSTTADPRWVIKLHRRSAAKRALRCWRWLEQTPTVRSPRLLGHSKGQHAIATAWLPGEPLAIALRAGLASTEQTRLAGVALGTLHQAPPDGLQPASADNTVDSAGAAVTILATLCPELVAAARSLHQQAAGILSIAAPAARSPIHGDFHAKQVLCMPKDGVALLDLDDAAVGTPLFDLACFAAHLLRDESVGAVSPGSSARHREALLDGYAAAGAALPPRRILHAATALMLLQMSNYPLRSRLADWPQRVAAIVAAAADEVSAAVSS